MENNYIDEWYKQNSTYSVDFMGAWHGVIPPPPIYYDRNIETRITSTTFDTQIDAPNTYKIIEESPGGSTSIITINPKEVYNENKELKNKNKELNKEIEKLKLDLFKANEKIETYNKSINKLINDLETTTRM